MLVSKWDSKWQWDMFQAKSPEWHTEKELIKPFLTGPEELLIYRELARELRIRPLMLERRRFCDATEAALKVFMDKNNGFSNLLAKTIEKAFLKSKELSSEDN